MRAAGYALRIASVTPDASPAPPGQGQVIALLRGSATLDELGGAGAVVHTARPDRSWPMTPGTVARVANDGRWRLHGDGLALLLATSVPRAAHRVDDLTARARRSWRCAPSPLFENEVVRVEWLTGRGRLPGRAGLTRPVGSDEVLVLLSGRAHVRDAAGAHTVEAPGWLPVAPPFRVEAAPRFLALLISPVLRRRVGAPDRQVVRGFTPFARA